MTWLRRNRLWLPLLPLCLALMLAASGYRVQKLWYDLGPHHRVGSTAGEVVTATLGYTDAYGDTSRTFSVHLTSFETQRRLPGYDGLDKGERPPPGTEAVAAHLTWSAAPDQSMTGCQVALLDDQGRRYEPPADSTQFDFCVPEDHAGPLVPGTKDQPRGYVEPGTERPRDWQTAVVFALPEGVRVTAVRVWWEPPDYVEVPAP